MAINGTGGNSLSPSITGLIEQQNFLSHGKPAKGLEGDVQYADVTEADLRDALNPPDSRGHRFEGFKKKRR